MRELSFEKEARAKLLEGAYIMYRAVATTLGPKGRNVAIAREWGPPYIMHDGVTVAREVASKDQFVNMGINLIRDAASRTNDEAGDGTTTSTLLAYFIIKYGMEMIESGKNPMVIRKQIYQALAAVLTNLKGLSTEVVSDDQVARVAKISAADETIGSLVSEAVQKLGREGIITVEESKTNKTYLETSEGLQMDQGWASPYFLTNPKTMEAVVENAQVVVLGKKVTAQNEIVPLLEVLNRNGKDIVLFGDIGGVALEIIIGNKMKGIINALVVDPPGYEERRRNLMEDIAIATGGQVIRDEIGLPMAQFAQQFDIKKVGYAKKVISSKRKTAVVEGGASSPERKAEVDKALSARIETLREQLKNETNGFEKEKIEERLAKLTTGVGVIRVGAKTDTEYREREERVKDAIGAAQAAKEEGIVPGGGITFLKLAESITDTSDGAQVLKKTLEEPIKKILLNAGENPEEFEKVLKDIAKKGGNYGYEVESSQVVDMVKEGIIDPTKVLRLALENAVSVATSILTTDCQIVIVKDKKDDES